MYVHEKTWNLCFVERFYDRSVQFHLTLLMQKRFHFSVQNLHIDMVRRGIKYLCICSFILLLFHMLFMFITVAKRSKYTPFLWSSFLIDTDANVCDSHSRERKRWSPPDKPTFMQTTIALKYEIFWSELCDSYVPKGKTDLPFKLFNSF